MSVITAAEASDKQASKIGAEITRKLGPVAPAAAAETVGAIDALLTQLEVAVTARDHADAQLESAETRLTKAIRAAGFADETGVAAALRDEAIRSALTSAIDVHDRGIANIERQLADPQLCELPTRRVDPGPLAQAAEVAACRHEEALTRADRFAGAAGALRGIADEHARSAAELAPLRAAAEIKARVADACDGRNQAKTSLHRWVLAAYLNDICEFASPRLLDMTSGRFSLHYAADLARNGARSGLGLKIADTYTGTERDPSSLSGGEKFQASLALALGVADAIANETGGGHDRRTLRRRRFRQLGP